MKRHKYDNLVLKGFNPDPCAIRVEDDYYVAVSTFEWYPGVVIYHTKDLVNYKLHSRPLSNNILLDMKGASPSSGIWAPSLSYNPYLKKYFLIYTVVKWRNMDREFIGENYVIEASDINGTWSAPTFLNSSGFDPDFFHDDDGKIYLINPRWDFRCEEDSEKFPFLKDIVIQEYDYNKKSLVGKAITIFHSTEIGLAEGPHIYKKEGYYYLIVAEGGTFYGHAVTQARSKDLYGPYEIYPNNPLLSSRDNDTLHLQKAGHGSIIDDIYGNYYMFHLCARPVNGTMMCTLGRETAIQNVVYKDGWFHMEHGSEPVEYFYSPYEVKQECQTKIKYEFNHLSEDFFVSRCEENLHNHEIVDNKLRVTGYGSLQSTYRKSHYAIKLKAHNVKVETAFTFEPYNMHQYAGLTLFYDEFNYYNLRIGFCEEQNTITLNLIKRVKGRSTSLYKYTEEYNVNSTYHKMKMIINEQFVSFYYYDKEWILVSENEDTLFLSDDAVDGFTGCFVGINCSDISGDKIYGEFECFDYEELR